MNLPRNREAMHNAWLRWHAIQTRCLSWTPAETNWDHFLRWACRSCVIHPHLERPMSHSYTTTSSWTHVCLSDVFCVCVCFFFRSIGRKNQQMASDVLCWCHSSRYRLLSSASRSSQPLIMMLSPWPKPAHGVSSLFTESPALPCPCCPPVSAHLHLRCSSCKWPLTSVSCTQETPEMGKIGIEVLGWSSSTAVCYSVAAFASEPGCCVGR